MRANHKEYVVLTATIVEWKVEEGEKVVDSMRSHDTMVDTDRARELVNSGLQWLTAWRSVEYSWPVSWGDK